MAIASYLSAWVSYLTLAVPYNKISPILLAFNFKELQNVCKPRYMKYFQTIFSNSYFFPTNEERLMFL